MTPMFKCSPCNKVYASKKALSKHDRQIHKIFKEVCYECEQCQTFFSSNRKLKNHNSKVHQLVSYECYDCGSTFPKKAEIISHVKIHKKSHENKNILCPIDECQETFNKYTSLHRHLTEKHNISVTQEKYEFKTEAEYNKWKKEKEQELKANYVKNTSKKYLKEGIRTYYECHRSLAPRITKNPKRNPKSMGTNKIGRVCPSVLIVTCNSENISAVLYPTHVGHNQELGRLRIDEADRNKIAGKLSQGVTVDRVLNDIRETVPKGQVERIHLVEKKDIHNIMRDYSIAYSTKRHQNDAVSVKLWVEAMKSVEKNPVLYYKEQGSQEDGMFEKNDFVLIIMTEFQANSLILFGNNKICINGTHGLNQYGFQLFTIIVVDEYGCGIPDAFCFSNRSDMIIFNKFFQCIKDRIGLISTKVFMSDDYPAFYLSWECVMGQVPQRLLCTWHINKNWIQNSNKIRNEEKRSLVLKSLRVLQKESDETEFIKQLKTFTDQLMAVPDTFQFFQYFSRNYFNRTNMWAYCYRKYAGINTNMYLESLHKIIKHFYLQGKKCKRLDKTINALMQLIRNKMFERVIKLEKHKISEKIEKIRGSHKRGESIPENSMYQKNENQWNVVSTKDADHSYLVEKILNNCTDPCELKCQKCNVCIHSFKCSCPDSVINHNICKHIHACCLKYHLNTYCPPPVEMTAPCYDLQNDVISFQNCSNNRDLIASKLEVILGLNKKCNLSDGDVSQIDKHLDKIIDIYNDHGQSDFKVKENVNMNKKIEPQVRLFSSKNKKRRLGTADPTQDPLPNESKLIKLALSNPNAEVLNIIQVLTTPTNNNY